MSQLSPGRGGRSGVRGVLVTAIAGVLMLGAAACGSSSSGTTSTGSKTSQAGESVAGKTVAIVGGPDSNPWSTYFNNTVKDALAKDGAKVSVTGTLDPATQVQMINRAAASHPDLLVLQALDSNAAASAVAKAKAQGVTVLNVDGRAAASAADGLNQVLSDNEALGRFAAQNIVEALQKQGRKTANIALITGTASMLVTQDRLKGFDAVMAKYPQYKVVSTQDGNWDPVKSGQIATQLFADYMALPVVTAAQQAGVNVGVKDDGLIITSSNCFKAGIDAIRAGTLYGTATEDPGTLGRATAAYAARMLSGQSVPLVQTVKEARVTKATLPELAAQCSNA
jgi:ABC-type sugar transport system substrate-binding protein